MALALSAIALSAEFSNVSLLMPVIRETDKMPPTLGQNAPCLGFITNLCVVFSRLKYAFCPGGILSGGHFVQGALYVLDSVIQHMPVIQPGQSTAHCDCVVTVAVLTASR